MRMSGRSVEFDVFICHASEDKEGVARPLAEKLDKAGLSVWYDEFELKMGDSLRKAIDRGLASSRYGVVVLSQAFFEKDWPQKELDGLVSLESNSRKVVLPVWHGVDKTYVAERSPLLADRLAASTESGIDHVVKCVLEAIAADGFDKRLAPYRKQAEGVDGKSNRQEARPEADSDRNVRSMVELVEAAHAMLAEANSGDLPARWTSAWMPQPPLSVENLMVVRKAVQETDEVFRTDIDMDRVSPYANDWITADDCDLSGFFTIWWCAHRSGFLYLTRRYVNDREEVGRRCFDWFLPVALAARAAVLGQKMVRALEVAAQTSRSETLAIYLKFDGLQGRHLENYDPRLIFALATAGDYHEIAHSFWERIMHVPVDFDREELITILAQQLADLYAQFRFFEMPQHHYTRVVQEILGEPES